MRRRFRGNTTVIDPGPIPILEASHRPVIDPESNILVSNLDHIPIVGASHRPSSIAIDPDPNILVSNVDHIPIVGAIHRPSSIAIDGRDPDPNILVIPIVGASRRPSSIAIDGRDPDQNTLVSNVDCIPIVEASHSPVTPVSNLNTRSLSNPIIQSHDTSASQNPHSSSTVSLTSPLPVSTLPSGRHISTVNDAIPTTQGPSSTSESVLAAEEARFLRRLYARNAPADEIAELMQAMRAREEAISRMAASSGPPAYDLSG